MFQPLHRWVGWVAVSFVFLTAGCDRIPPHVRHFQIPHGVRHWNAPLLPRIVVVLGKMSPGGQIGPETIRWQTLAQLIDRMSDIGGELIIMFLCDTGHAARLTIPPPPEVPHQLLITSDSIRNRRLAEIAEAERAYGQDMEAYRAAVQQRIETFRAAVEPRLGQPHNCDDASPTTHALHDLDLILQELAPAGIRYRNFALLATVGLDPLPQGHTTQQYRRLDKATFLLLTGATTLHDMEALRPARFESADSLFTYLASQLPQEQTPWIPSSTETDRHQTPETSTDVAATP